MANPARWTVEGQGTNAKQLRDALRARAPQLNINPLEVGNNQYFTVNEINQLTDGKFNLTDQTIGQSGFSQLSTRGIQPGDADADASAGADGITDAATDAIGNSSQGAPSGGGAGGDKNCENPNGQGGQDGQGGDGGQGGEDGANSEQGPSEPAGPAAPGVAPGYEESGLTKQQIEDYIRKDASSKGLDPEYAVKVYRGEGATAYQSKVIQNGRREPSYGPYQLYYGGGVGNAFTRDTGIDLRTNRSADAILASIRYTHSYIAKQGIANQYRSWRREWFGAPR